MIIAHMPMVLKKTKLSNKIKIHVFEPTTSFMGLRRAKNAQKWFDSTHLLISFRMIPHMPIVISKIEIRVFWAYDLIYGPL